MKKIKKTRRYFKPIVAGCCAVLAFSFYFFFFVFTPPTYTKAEPGRLVPLRELRPTDRITVVSPHLDDETLGVGGFIAEARQKNIPVSIIFMTNGDANYIGVGIDNSTLRPKPAQYIAYGEMRQQETLKATSELGVPPADVYFLGLPDQGLKALLTSQYATDAYTSSYTKTNRSTYRVSTVPNLSYTGQAAQQALNNLINKTQPTILMTTIIEDIHPDHAATGRFVQNALPSLTTHPEIENFLIHYLKFPTRSSQTLLPPQKLSGKNWQTIQLTPEAVAVKQRAVNDYKSQLEVPVLNRLMQNLVRSNELLTPSF